MIDNVSDLDHSLQGLSIKKMEKRGFVIKAEVNL